MSYSADNVAPVVILSTALTTVAYLHYIEINNMFSLAVEAGNSAFIKNIGHNKFINLNRVDMNGSTLLHRAAISGNLSVISELLKLGASLDAVDTRGYTPILTAVEHNKIQAANLLLADGDCAAVEGVLRLSDDKAGRMLISASYSGMPEVVRTLISCGVGVDSDIAHSDVYVITPFYAACIGKHYDIATYLLERGASYAVPYTMFGIVANAISVGDIETLRATKPMHHVMQDLSDDDAERYFARHPVCNALSDTLREYITHGDQPGLIEYIEDLISQNASALCATWCVHDFDIIYS